MCVVLRPCPHLPGVGRCGGCAVRRGGAWEVLKGLVSGLWGVRGLRAGGVCVLEGDDAPLGAGVGVRVLGCWGVHLSPAVGHTCRGHL